MKHILLDDFLKFKYVSSLKTSPNRKRLSFLASQADLKKNDYPAVLYTVEKGKAMRLINMKDAGDFVYETDDSILFQMTKSKKEEKLKKDQKSIYYRYDFVSKKVTYAYTFNAPLSIANVFENGDVLLTGMLSDEQLKLLTDDEKKRKVILDLLKKEKAYEEVDQIPFYFNGAGFIANKKSRLFIYEPNTSELKLISDPDFHVEGFDASEDDIYMHGYMLSDVMPLCNDIYRYDLKGEILEKVLDNKKFMISGLERVEQKLVVLATKGDQFGLNEDPDFYTLEKGKLKLLAPFGFSIGNSIGADIRYGSNPQSVVVDGMLYFIETVDDHTVINKVDLEGDIIHVYDMNGSVDGIAYYDNDIFLVGLYRQKLQEVYRISEEKLVQVSSLNSSVLRSYYVAKPKRIEVKRDGYDVTGFILHPYDYDPEKKYPAILDIHGGPKTAYGQVYFHEMQYWANKGYFVLYCNPTGSDGKGGEFADIRGKYGTIDYEDIMAFTKKVLKKNPAIDKEHVYVTGGSYGGYMTNWIVGHTNMFKAAATQRSISNWISFHGTSDIGYYFASDQNGAHPFDDLNKLWEHSPLKYVKQIKTPLLFIHSDEDYRCPIEQATQLFVPLKERGIDTKLIWFKGENHELSRGGKPQARLKRLSAITEWFEAHQ